MILRPRRIVVRFPTMPYNIVRVRWDLLQEVISKLTLRRAVCDDRTDQLHHVVIVSLLLGMSLLVGASQFVGDPVRCWIPKEYSTDDDHFTDYVNSYCFITPMYHFPTYEPIPTSRAEREKTEIGFYRWVVVMFLFQALLFYGPHMMWQLLQGECGINVKKVIEMAIDAHLGIVDEKEREETLSHAAIFIDRWLTTYRDHSASHWARFSGCFSKTFFCFGTKSGSYLVELYLLVKLLNLANVLGQFALLGAFLQMDYVTYGFDVLLFLSENEDWRDVDHFPRISLCDFQIRQLQNVQDWTVQCVLSINMFLEKLYACSWFVFAAVAIATLCNLLSWVTELMTSSRREAFLDKHRLKMKHMNADNETLFKKFCREYLRPDGVFMLRMIERNTTIMTSQDIFSLLWVIFLWKDGKLSNWEATDTSKLLDEFWKKESERKKIKTSLLNGECFSNFKRSVDL
ncbi:innexin unc-9-like [Gigantopelta aegis]|uniref:innexin unc-9-like n=1 Tax=Gigantopelta aegis TaxID=1735272 RepID=UPI001B88854F|nr:innexin unc-9-like [Gigantopelta aegis]